MPKNKEKTVLIVEDEESLAHALEYKLVQAGYVVKVAFDGKQAIQAIQKETFDVILLDLVMPKLDGFEFLVAIQDIPTKPHILILSNLGQKEDIDRATALGAERFFIKADQSIDSIIDAIHSL